MGLWKSRASSMRRQSSGWPSDREPAWPAERLRHPSMSRVRGALAARSQMAREDGDELLHPVFERVLPERSLLSGGGQRHAVLLMLEQSIESSDELFQIAIGGDLTTWLKQIAEVCARVGNQRRPHAG